MSVPTPITAQAPATQPNKLASKPKILDTQEPHAEQQNPSINTGPSRDTVQASKPSTVAYSPPAPAKDTTELPNAMMRNISLGPANHQLPAPPINRGLPGSVTQSPYPATVVQYMQPRPANTAFPGTVMRNPYSAPAIQYMQPRPANTAFPGTMMQNPYPAPAIQYMQPPPANTAFPGTVMQSPYPAPTVQHMQPPPASAAIPSSMTLNLYSNHMPSPTTNAGLPNATPAPSLPHTTATPAPIQKAKKSALRQFLTFSTIGIGSLAGFAYLLKDSELLQQLPSLASLSDRLQALQNTTSKNSSPLNQASSPTIPETSESTANAIALPLKPSISKNDAALKRSITPSQKAPATSVGKRLGIALGSIGGIFTAGLLGYGVLNHFVEAEARNATRRRRGSRFPSP